MTKDEVCGKIVTEFTALRAKMHAYRKIDTIFFSITNLRALNTKNLQSPGNSKIILLGKT